MTAADGSKADRGRRGPSRRYHLTMGGVMYVAVCVFLLVGAVNSQNNLLFAALGLGIAGLIVSGVVSGSALLGVIAERIDVSESAVGSPTTVRYAVTNRSRFMPAFGLMIEEMSPRENGAGFMRVRAFVGHVGPRERVLCEGMTWPARRGDAVFDRIRLSTTFPFGIARKSVTFSQPHSVLVLPLSVRGRTRGARMGTTDAHESRRASPRVGASGEIYGVREYVHGDVPRHIAWRASARSDRLIVTQRAQPQPMRILVAIRFAGKGRTPEKDEWAISVAASMIRRALADGVGVGLAVPSAKIFHAPRTGRWPATRLLSELARLTPGEGVEEDLVIGRALDASVVAVHSGAVDPSWGPAGTRHVEATSIRELVDAAILDAFLPGPTIETSGGRRLHARARRATLAARTAAVNLLRPREGDQP